MSTSRSVQFPRQRPDCRPSRRLGSRHRDRRLGAAGARFGLALLPLLVCACAVEPDGPAVDQFGQALENEQTPEAETLLIDDASPTPITIRWEDASPSSRANVLPARLHNTTEQPITVTLQVMAVGPSAQVLTRPLGQHAVPGKISLPLRLPIALLPIQSVDASSQVVLIATYETTQPAHPPMQSAIQRSDHVYAMSRHVTFDADFTQATIRTPLEQRKHVAESLREGRLPVPTALRLYNPKTDTMDTVSGPELTPDIITFTVTGTPPGRDPILPTIPPVSRSEQ
jgi:hypothetical protein